MSERQPKFPFEWPPNQSGHGTARRWRREIQGTWYTFTAVLMPDGERRYFANRFNGYAGGMNYACAWTPVLEWIFKPEKPKPDYYADLRLLVSLIPEEVQDDASYYAAQRLLDLIDKWETVSP